MEIRQRPIEVIEKRGIPKLIGCSNCKDMYKVFETVIAQQTKQGNTELRVFAEGLYSMFKKFYPKQEAQVNVKSWRGKSGIEIIPNLDKLIVLRYQKADQDSEAKPVTHEANKEQLQYLVSSFNYLIENKGNKFKSKDIAAQYCMRDQKHWKKLEGKKIYDNVFLDRKFHNWFTTMLRAFDELKIITYRKDNIEVLQKPISIQLILPGRDYIR